MKERWVDIGKFFAILAVMTDHVYGDLYTSNKINRVSYFSVPLFIMLMGVTTFWSFNRSTDMIGKKIVRRMFNIVIPYTVAVFIYYVICFKGFSWNEYKNYLINFNISKPHYYVLLYLQLLVVAPVVFYFIKIAENHKYPHIIEILWGGGILCVSFFTNSYTKIADIEGGGGVLFGGSYLLVFFIGMLMGKYVGVMSEMKVRNCFILAVVLLLCALLMGYAIGTKGLFLDVRKMLGIGKNPSGFTLILYAFLIMVCICLWDKGISCLVSDKMNYFIDGFAWIGRQTLYIFLYHRLFLDYFLNSYFSELTRIIKIPLYYLTMLFGSIGMGYLHKYLRKLLVSSYTYAKEK